MGYRPKNPRLKPKSSERDEEQRFQLLKLTLLDDLASCNISGTPRIAATRTIAGRLKKSATRYAGPYFDSDGREVG